MFHIETIMKHPYKPDRCHSLSISRLLAGADPLSAQNFYPATIAIGLDQRR